VQDLAKPSPDVKAHAMKALASLSKFLDKERMMPKHHQFTKSVHKADKE
jgi:hypothetical protein